MVFFNIKLVEDVFVDNNFIGTEDSFVHINKSEKEDDSFLY